MNEMLAEKIANQMISVDDIQTIAIGDASAQSAAVGENTRRVVLIANTDCWIAVGGDPTAAAHNASFYLAAGIPFYPIKVQHGVTKIAVIRDSADGYLSIIESL